MDDLATLAEPRHAELLMHPLRRGILERAASAPVSATEVARDLGEARQKVNYHLRQLVDAGLLDAAGERPRRGLTEKLYRASAHAYVVSPEVLGALAPDAARLAEAGSAAALVALAGRIQADVVRAGGQARSQGKRLATLSLETEVWFESAAQQAAFAEALTQAVADVTARFSAPAGADGTHRYRVVAGAYPRPLDEPSDPATPGENGP